MKKKLICTAIILTMVTSLTACGSNPASDIASDDSMAVSTEIATDSEAEKETTETDSALSANNKGDASDSTNKPAINNSTSSTNGSKPNRTTASTASTTESPRQDSHTSAQTSATTEAPATETPRTTEAQTTEAPSAPRTCNHNWHEIDHIETVVDQEAYDEKIPTGEYHTTLEKHLYSYAMSNEDVNSRVLYTVDITGMSREQLRQYEKDNNLLPYCLNACWSDYIEVPDYNNPIYETVHHDAVTHEERVVDYMECTICGAHK